MYLPVLTILVCFFVFFFENENQHFSPFFIFFSLLYLTLFFIFNFIFFPCSSYFVLSQSSFCQIQLLKYIASCIS